MGTIPFAIAFWMISMFTVRFSGAHHNPVLSLILAFYGGKDPFPKLHAVIYCIAQSVGALFGALLAWFLTRSGGNLHILSNKYFFQAIAVEIAGSFLMGIVWVILNEPVDVKDAKPVKRESH